MAITYLCPYFRKEKTQNKDLPAVLYCEGGTMRFKDKQMRRDWVYKSCAGDYQSCQIYQLLCDFYERKNNPRG